jgi:drug/metabolite transporter (DMT)-like permease
VVLLVMCGLFWSSAGLLIKLVDANPVAIWSVRCAVCALTLGVIGRPTLKNMTRDEWAAAAANALTTGLFVVANKLTTAANAILIQYSAPVWIALLGAWFLGERATRLDWFTIAAVLGGIALFFFERLTVDHVAGNLVALAAGVAYAFQAMCLRRAATRGGDALRALFLGSLMGALIGMPVVLLTLVPTSRTIGALLVLGVVQQGFAYLCYARAAKDATALEAMLIPVIEPILSPLWVALAVREVPGPWALVGGAVVVGAVTARGLLARSKPG